MISLAITGIIFLLAVAAFFDASEIAIISTDRLFVKKLINEKNKSARFIDKLQSNPEWIFAVTLFYADICIISSTSLMEFLMHNYFHLPERYSVLISSVIMSILVLLFTQIIPKSIGLKNSKVISLKVAPVLRLLSVFLYPIVKLAEGVISLLRSMGVDIPHKKSIITRAEVILSLDETSELTHTRRYALDMMSSSIFLAETALIDIMTEIENFPTLNINSSIERALTLMKEVNQESIPAFSGDEKNIVGIVYIKDILNLEPDRALSDFLRIPLTFYQTVSPTEVLEGLRKHQTKLGFVYREEAEEKREIVGVITIDDVVTQVVGEI